MLPCILVNKDFHNFTVKRHNWQNHSIHKYTDRTIWMLHLMFVTSINQSMLFDVHRKVDKRAGNLVCRT